MDALTRIASDYRNERARFDIVTDGINTAVRKSLAGQPMASLTEDEIKRRVSICASWFVKLRYEAGWGTQRSADALVECLRCELTGVSYEPSKRQSWCTDGSSDRDRIILLK